MASKGSSYAQVDVDLAQWAKDQLDWMGLTRAELVRRLRYPDGKPLHRARLTELLDGKTNTIFMLKLIADSFEGGRYWTFLRYATSEEGRRLLQRLDFESRLDEQTWPLWDKELMKTRKKFATKYLKVDENPDRIIEAKKKLSGQPT